MNPKERELLRLTEKGLRRSSFGNYLKLLRALLESHRQYNFLAPLSSALRSRDYEALYKAADSLSSQQYDDATQHFVANQFALLVKKYPFPKQELDLRPQENAVKAFLTAEKRCGLMNRKFRYLNLHRSRDKYVGEAKVARSWIRSVLSSSPNYGDIFNESDFGSGASVGVHGNATHVVAKLMREKWSVTPGAIHHAYGALSHNAQFHEILMERRGGLVCYDQVRSFTEYTRRMHVVMGNKISFVPKTAKTHRTIAVEPLLNGLVQKGIDQVMRRKLLRFGLDLSDQTLNQRFACEGSTNDTEDGFVSIDLKAASDSISHELVRYLLPDDWYRLLQRTRSHHYSLDKVVRPYEKFCSMGNGFCFPLETLLFAAACVATGAGRPGVDFTVYGDDILVRKKYATQLLLLLKHWGFKYNPEKTFIEGPFRESCGADWFGGEDVRPFTLDYALDSVENVFKFLNLTRRSERCEAFFQCVRGSVTELLPPRYQFFRPLPGEPNTGIDSLGDEHLTSPHCRFLRGSGRWRWRELHRVPIVDENLLKQAKDEPWLIGVALRGTLSVPHGMLKGLPGVTLRAVTRTKVVWKGYSSTSNWLPTPRDVTS